ncbi:GspH/FimT family pseudopilin [Xylophilus sp. GOD-11R]|uniref:GspH/FimT family pseudopilin n=1 Tax=Xylophilus sp. GOD-11R TaxID=3089814 RepID=UPI00298D5C8D|nr:GspH/FimT family pseudopilin [Xylophilus sp. GOD-11R]WPB59300.1 GspH/FimT family pseudopilin [Xylophilus sp. GOD-11R]
MRGVFLVELMVCLLVAAVLLALGLPGLRSMLRDMQVRVAAQDLVGALAWTRAEAVRGGAAITLRFRPRTECISPPARRHCGWEVFRDLDGNTKRDASEKLLAVHALPVQVDLPDVSSSAIQYLADGAVSTKGVHIVIGPTGAATGDPATRIVCSQFGGRVRIAMGEHC